MTAASERRMKVVQFHVEEEARALRVPDRYPEVLLVVFAEGAVLGELRLPVIAGQVSAPAQEAAIADRLAGPLRRRQLAMSFRRAARGPEPLKPPERMGAGGVTVVVCTRDRPDELRLCLESLVALRTAPTEILVVDNAPSDQRGRDLCRKFPVRYVLEPERGLSRARNRGFREAATPLVAFTDDDCVADPDWLTELDEPFRDPLVKAVAGYVGPREVETEAQYLFELHGGFERRFERVVFDGSRGDPLSASGLGDGNSIFRRTVWEECGGFAEDLGPGTAARSAQDAYLYYRILAAGYRIAFEPQRVLWHRHRRGYTALRRTLGDYALGVSAHATRCLLTHREPGAARLWTWWLRHICCDFEQTARGSPIPFGIPLSELLGLAAGPAALLRSRLATGRGRSPRWAPEPFSGQARVTSDHAPITVAIASRNRAKRLAQVLEALRRGDQPAHRVEVVVVLDGSDDASAALVREFEAPYRLRLVTQPRQGLAAARNRGAREASEPLLLFLDDDIVPTPTLVSEHARAHARSGADRVVLGYHPVSLEQPSLWGYALRAWWEDHFRRRNDPRHQWSFVDYADGNSSMPRALLDRHGGFDEDFSGGRRHDWELAVRLLEAGAAFVQHDAARGDHHLDARFSTSLRNAREEARFDVLLASKHPRARGRLPLARAMRPQRQRAVKAAVALAPPFESALASLRLYRPWRRCTRDAMWGAYLLGLADASERAPGAPDATAGHDVASASEAAQAGRLRVPLDIPGPIEAPPASRSLAVIVESGGSDVAAVEGIEPGEQWDWDALTARVVDDAERRFHGRTEERARD